MKIEATRRQWVKFAIVLALWLAFLVWLKSWLGLVVVPFIFDAYITKKIPWTWWESSKNETVRSVMSWVDAIVFALVAIPMSYQFRLIYYILMDKPHYGAMLAVRESKQLMRRNRSSLFRLDLSFWWYYLLSALASLLCYGDSILHLMGISLPLSDGVSYFLFYGLYLAALFAIYYCFRNRVGITYALAYESLKPKEETSGGVALGNIFQM